MADHDVTAQHLPVKETPKPVIKEKKQKTRSSRVTNIFKKKGKVNMNAARGLFVSEFYGRMKPDAYMGAGGMVDVKKLSKSALAEWNQLTKPQKLVYLGRAKAAREAKTISTTSHPNTILKMLEAVVDTTRGMAHSIEQSIPDDCEIVLTMGLCVRDRHNDLISQASLAYPAPTKHSYPPTGSSSSSSIYPSSETPEYEGSYEDSPAHEEMAKTLVENMKAMDRRRTLPPGAQGTPGVAGSADITLADQILFSDSAQVVLLSIMNPGGADQGLLNPSDIEHLTKVLAQARVNIAANRLNDSSNASANNADPPPQPAVEVTDEAEAPVVDAEALQKPESMVSPEEMEAVTAILNSMLPEAKDGAVAAAAAAASIAPALEPPVNGEATEAARGRVRGRESEGVEQPQEKKARTE